jgi:acyl-CoA dehydrogenase
MTARWIRPGSAPYELPFFEPRHREFADRLDAWAAEHLQHPHDESRPAVDAHCRHLVQQLGRAGWLKACVPAAHGGLLPVLESRTLVILREVLAAHTGLADFAAAMQGLGSGPITLAGTAAQQQRWLPAVARGEAIAAFALSEPEAGSDVAAMKTRARPETRQGVPGWRIDGSKTWISNGGIADFYCVFARSRDMPGARGISAFLIPADTPGLFVSDRQDVVAPHPLATLSFDNCWLPDSALLGEPEQGFKLAMATLDIFRASVAAAALGFARRALSEALAHARQRPMFGGVLADLQLSQSSLAQMATDIDAAALLTYRAAWLRDVQGVRCTREVAMAKMTATESAQRVVDRAVQLLGARGVQRGHIVESLYREVRALRIYEGATEVQQLIIGRELLKA